MNIFDPKYTPKIRWKVNQQDLNNLVKELRALGHIISDPNMQLYRAQKFKEYTVKWMSSGLLGLDEIGSLTRFLAGGDHPPVWNTGNLVENMGVRPAGKNEAEAGYWGSQGNMPGKNISIAGWVRALHTGFRIPLTGDKGKKVKGWYWHQTGKHFTSETLSKGYLFVKARPFMIESYNKYIDEDLDVAACEEYIDKLLNSPVDTTKTRTATNNNEKFVDWVTSDFGGLGKPQ